MPEVYIFNCRSCDAQVIGVQVAYCDLEGTLVVETRCPICERNLGIMIDRGTLDLGLVRDEQLGKNDFEIFS